MTSKAFWLTPLTDQVGRPVLSVQCAVYGAPQVPQVQPVFEPRCMQAFLHPFYSGWLGMMQLMIWRILTWLSSMKISSKSGVTIHFKTMHLCTSWNSRNLTRSLKVFCWQHRKETLSFIRPWIWALAAHDFLKVTEEEARIVTTRRRCVYVPGAPTASESLWSWWVAKGVESRVSRQALWL